MASIEQVASTFPAFPLASKIIAITGAGSGINLAFAKLAVKAGARVIIADIRLTAEALSFIKEFEPSGRRDLPCVQYHECDVTKRKDLEGVVSLSEGVFGDVPDVYVAGAGVFEPTWSNFWDDTEEDSYAQVDINVTHPMKLSRIAIRALLRKGKKGVVLVVASLAGYRGTLPAPLYTATKHACVGFVRSMEGLDQLEGIKIVLVAPGMVNTPLWTMRPELVKQFGLPDEIGASPDEVAKAMAELVTDGRYPSGTCLEVAGGSTRVLGTWNIEPPKTFGSTISRQQIQDAVAPIRKILDKERESS